MSFEFQPGDADALKALCLKARKLAKNNPCFTPDDCGDPKFRFRFGSWSLCCTWEALVPGPRVWHGSAAVLAEIGTQPAMMPSGLIVQVPQEALLANESWEKEHKDQAKFLLGELLGPVIIKDDQTVNVISGLFSEHWQTSTHA